MSKLDFSSLTDAQLLREEDFLLMELDAAIANMIDDGKLKLIYSQLDEIEDEKDKRGLSG